MMSGAYEPPAAGVAKEFETVFYDAQEGLSQFTITMSH